MTLGVFLLFFPARAWARASLEGLNTSTSEDGRSSLAESEPSEGDGGGRECFDACLWTARIMLSKHATREEKAMMARKRGDTTWMRSVTREHCRAECAAM